MQQVKRRRPQTRCKCGHARSNHARGYETIDNKLTCIDKWFRCGYCWNTCLEFQQNNLVTLEKLYQFNEEKKISL